MFGIYHEEYIKTRYLLGNDYIKNGKYDDALKHYF